VAVIPLSIFATLADGGRGRGVRSDKRTAHMPLADLMAG
jgi:hypothetical protein